MARRVSAAEAKAQLPLLVAEVAHGGQHYVIERRGKPVAALVSVDDLQKLEQVRAMSERPLGVLALVGAWREISSEEIDRITDEIYAERARDTGRAVAIED